MERILSPKFSSDRKTKWLDMFKYFLESIESLQLDKLRTLVTWVPPKFYDYIRGWAIYQSTRDILTKLYI